MRPPVTAPFESILSGLEAAAEITRLRLLALLAEAELTVSELMTILGQSQPRISRHLKLLVEAGLIERHREGAWAFFRVADQGAPGELVRGILGHIAANDPVLSGDKARLAEVRKARATEAARYFADHASHWDQLRSLHVAEEAVERAMREIIGDAPLLAVLDLGTGTGRMLELIAPQAARAVGIDQSPAMLNLARTRLEKAGLRNVQLRQGDIYALPVERNGYDLVIVHQVLHYLDDPARALREAARVLRPGGRIVVVDFAPHTNELLREKHAHRRLGFAASEVEGFLNEAGLESVAHRDLVSRRTPEKLSVSIWIARDPRLVSDVAPASLKEFA